MRSADLIRKMLSRCMRRPGTFARAMFLAALVAGCGAPTSPTPTPSCGPGTYQVGNVCEAITYIAIGPGVHPPQVAPGGEIQYSYPPTCFTLSPTPANARVSHTIQFQNMTSSTLTIIAQDGTPWVSVGPGETSNSLYFTTPGTRLFAIQSCYQSFGGNGGAMAFAAYGSVNVSP